MKKISKRKLQKELEALLYKNLKFARIDTHRVVRKNFPEVIYAEGKKTSHLEQIAEEIIFKPIGMDHSTFVYPLNSEKKKQEAMPHDAQGISREPSMHLTALAHGGLTTTSADLAKFTNELFFSYQGESEKVLSQKMIKQLLNKEFDLDPGLLGIPLSEGLGVFLAGEGPNLLFTHPGSNLPGLNCWLIGWPEIGNAVVVMTNGAQGELLAMEIISAFIQEYFKTIDG